MLHPSIRSTTPMKLWCFAVAKCALLRHFMLVFVAVDLATHRFYPILL